MDAVFEVEIFDNNDGFEKIEDIKHRLEEALRNEGIEGNVRYVWVNGTFEDYDLEHKEIETKK